MRADLMNSAVLSCIEFAAKSTPPPEVSAADYLYQLLDSSVLPVEEVEQVALRVDAIVTGIKAPRSKLTEGLLIDGRD